MIIQTLKNTDKYFELQLEETIEEAEVFFKNKGIIYQAELKHNIPPKHFNDTVKEYIKLKFGDKYQDVIKHIPRIIIKYNAFFEEGKDTYKEL